MAEITTEEAAVETGKRDFLTAHELAAHLRVSLNTVRHWRKRGYLPPAYQLGTRVIWRLAEIERWLAQKREKASNRVRSEVSSAQHASTVRRRS